MYSGIERRRQALNPVGRGHATKNGKISPVEVAELRRASDEQLKAKAAPLSRTLEETRRLLQELQLHQIELETQNAELRQARDQADLARQKYNDLYDLAPVGYLTLDSDGAIRDVNLTGASLLGVERSLLLGRRFGLLVAHEARPAFNEFLGKVFTNRTRETCEVELLGKGKRPLFVQIETVSSASGQECRAAIIDISARRRAERDRANLHADLAARAAKLEHANIELEAFNYTVSHDLCGPLTTINGFSEILMGICKDQLDENSRGYLQGIHQGTLRMKKLIASLLDFSRVTRGGLHRKTFDLSAMAKAVAADLRVAHPESRVTFLVGEGLMGNGDAGLCRIVLDNLMGNAWKYSVNRVGTIIEFGMTELGGKPVCFVCDNGPGFDMAHAGKLFVPFQRIPGSDVAGNGIGLATVKRIVKRHGGRVWAESSPGEGATFFFILE